MNKFVIEASLDNEKNLTFTNIPQQNQGENNCSVIEISLPTQLAEGVEFYLEFLCPKNKRYISQKLIAQPNYNEMKITCDIPSCVLQEEGFVRVQLVARSVEDETVVFKSNQSNKTSFFVYPSVNATQLFTVTDYFAHLSQLVAQADLSLAEVGTAVADAQSAASDVRAVIGETEDLKDALDGYLVGLDGTIDEKMQDKFSEEKQALFDRMAEETLARQQADGAISQSLSAHKSDLQNPHNVTKQQVGLNNVDNVRQFSTINPNFSNALPLENGVASTGSATTYSHSDHIHPSDRLKADANNVVTLSQQNLTEAQKAQVKQNLGIAATAAVGDFFALTNRPMAVFHKTNTMHCTNNEVITLANCDGIYSIHMVASDILRNAAVEISWNYEDDTCYHEFTVPTYRQAIDGLLFVNNNQIWAKFAFILNGLATDFDEYCCTTSDATLEMCALLNDDSLSLDVTIDAYLFREEPLGEDDD